MTVHATPPHGATATPCCDTHPDDLPAGDRLTLNPTTITCTATTGKKLIGCPEWRRATVLHGRVGVHVVRLARAGTDAHARRLRSRPGMPMVHCPGHGTRPEADRCLSRSFPPGSR